MGLNINISTLRSEGVKLLLWVWGPERLGQPDCAVLSCGNRDFCPNSPRLTGWAPPLWPWHAPAGQPASFLPSQPVFSQGLVNSWSGTVGNKEKKRTKERSSIRKVNCHWSQQPNLDLGDLGRLPGIKQWAEMTFPYVLRPIQETLAYKWK